MANPTTENLTSASVGTAYATRLVTNAKMFQFVFTGTDHVGVQGDVQGSKTGVAGTYVKIAAIREDTGAAFNGIVGNSQFSVIGNCGSWKYVRFNPTQITSGTVAVTMDDGQTFDLPLGVTPLNVASQSGTVTSASANALAIGPAGTTNPSFNVDASAGSAATGWQVTAAAAASGAALTVISSGTNENGTIDAKGSGTLTLNGTATGAITLARATAVTGAITGTSASASALTVGLNGATNPALQIDASTASSATGLKVKSAAAAAGVALSVISSGTNEALTIDAKGSGTISIGATSTGSVNIGGNAKTVLPGTLTAGGLLTCALQIATSGPLIYSGSGAPSISAAVKGSIYLRTDGSSTSTRAYVATDTSGAWAAFTTAS